VVVLAVLHLPRPGAKLAAATTRPSGDGSGRQVVAVQSGAAASKCMGWPIWSIDPSQAHPRGTEQPSASE
jgi:hypothetical protein